MMQANPEYLRMDERHAVPTTVTCCLHSRWPHWQALAMLRSGLLTVRHALSGGGGWASFFGGGGGFSGGGSPAVASDSISMNKSRNNGLCFKTVARPASSSCLRAWVSATLNLRSITQPSSQSFVTGQEVQLITVLNGKRIDNCHRAANLGSAPPPCQWKSVAEQVCPQSFLYLMTNHGYLVFMGVR